MQAIFFADGGIIAFGMNLFNMAISRRLKLLLIKLLTQQIHKPPNGSHQASSLPHGHSVMLGAVIAAFEVAPAFAGGIAVTLPAMLFFHAIIGIGEGAITTVLANNHSTV